MGYRSNPTLTAAMLLLALIAVASSACGDASDAQNEEVTDAVTTASNTAAGSETLDDAPPLPDIDCTGKTFTIYNTFYNDGKYTNTMIYPEETTGDSLEDAMYIRCVKTEERLGCEIAIVEGEVAQTKKNIAAGDDFANVTMATLTDIMSFVNAGYCIDLYDLPNINLDNPWWDQNAEEKFRFNSHLYYTFNDSIFLQMDNARAFFFNKQMIEDFDLDNPYQLVRDGKWTFDALWSLGRAVISDLDGDGAYTEADRYGLLGGSVLGMGEVLLTGADAEIIKQGENYVPYFYCLEERFEAVYTDILDILTKDNLFFCGGTDLFMDGHGLFQYATLAATKGMRDMETDFGIIPVPKYDEAQEKYWQVSPNAHALYIPATITDPEFTGAVMEELAYQSGKYLIPAYYDVLLKGKTTRDEESLEMLDIIHDGISYVIKIIGTQFSDALYRQMELKKYDIASFIAKNEEKITKKLQQTLEEFAD